MARKSIAFQDNPAYAVTDNVFTGNPTSGLWNRSTVAQYFSRLGITVEVAGADTGFIGNVNAAQFVKNGGTAVQFLKADGSSDATQYLPLTGGNISGPINGTSANFTGEVEAAFFTGGAISGTTLALTGALTGTIATLTGLVTGQGFAIPGGTAAMFLKANGTIDSNTYLTTAAGAATYLPLIGGTLTGTLNGTSIKLEGDGTTDLLDLTRLSTLRLRVINAGENAVQVGGGLLINQDGPFNSMEVQDGGVPAFTIADGGTATFGGNGVVGSQSVPRLFTINGSQALGGLVVINALQPLAQNFLEWDASQNGRLVLRDATGASSIMSAIGAAMSFAGEVIRTTAVNGDSKISIINTTSGNNARASVTLSGGGVTGALIATSPLYSGIASWASALVLSADSAATGGVIIRSSAGNINFQPNSTSSSARVEAGGNFAGENFIGINAALTTIRRVNLSGELVISAGTSSSSSANILLRGSSHASYAAEAVRIRAEGGASLLNFTSAGVATFSGAISSTSSSPNVFAASFTNTNNNTASGLRVQGGGTNGLGLILDLYDAAGNARFNMTNLGLATFGGDIGSSKGSNWILFGDGNDIVIRPVSQVSGTGAVTINNTGTTFAGLITGSLGNFDILKTNNTGRLSIGGGSTPSAGTGALINAHGNDSAGLEGQLILSAGTGAIGNIRFNVNGSQSVLFEKSGSALFNSLIGTGSRQVVASATGVLSAPVSDENLKDIIGKLDTGLDFVLAAAKCTIEFLYKDKDWNAEGHNNWGFGARAVEAEFGHNPAFRELNNEYAWDSPQMIAPAYNAIAELEERIKFLESKLLS